jgi:hypothetical protein
MAAKIIPQRTRFFLAVEGESEQSLVKWWQELAGQQGLHIHLECHPLSGGGFKTMLERAVSFRKRGVTKGAYKASFLVVDEDRAAAGDWPISQLKQEAASQNITVCCQRPNLEGMLLRMMPGKENATFTGVSSASQQLVSAWPNYRKPVDARTLGSKYSLDDLKRVARIETDLHELLRVIGLLR